MKKVKVLFVLIITLSNSLFAQQQNCFARPIGLGGSFETCEDDSPGGSNFSNSSQSNANLAPFDCEGWNSNNLTLVEGPYPIIEPNFELVESPDGGNALVAVSYDSSLSNPVVEQSFSTTLTNLEVGKLVKFRYYHAIANKILPNKKNAALQWSITFNDNPIAGSILTLNESNINKWFLINKQFTANSDTGILKFTSKSNHYGSGDDYDLLVNVIDGIRVLVEKDCNSNNPSGDCDDCDSFKPIPGQKYVLGGWVKEDLPNQVKSYANSSVTVNYLDTSGAVLSSSNFAPEDQIIDEWQRIYGEFLIPSNTASIQIVLNNNSGTSTYFDDIRIHPFNGNMKSFVYDPITQRLMAELDENNYSTFYEYDKEGGLVRVKKETEKGVYTIQETRSKSKTEN